MKLPTLKCNRCGHKWFPRSPKEPERCPACNSPYWNKPRVRKVNRRSKYAEKEDDVTAND